MRMTSWMLSLLLRIHLPRFFSTPLYVGLMDGADIRRPLATHLALLFLLPLACRQDARQIETPKKCSYKTRKDVRHHQNGGLVGPSVLVLLIQAINGECHHASSEDVITRYSVV